MIKYFKRNRRQGGFTMVELVFVVVVIGILATVAAKQFGVGIFGGAKSEAMYETTKKVSQNAVLLTQAAGVTSAAAANPLAAAGKTLLDVLISGPSNIAAAYASSWDIAGISPLNNAIQVSGGVYSVSGYNFTFGGGGSSPHSFVFVNIPDSLTKQLVAKHGSGVQTLAASDTTDPNVQYSVVDASGNRTVTIFQSL